MFIKHEIWKQQMTMVSVIHFWKLHIVVKNGKTQIIKKTLNPQWMEQIILNVDVPQPAAYAPRIRCLVYDWDRLSGNDFLGRFFISFQDCIDMMKQGKPKWYDLQDTEGNQVQGRVYVAVEFIDANNKKEPIFNMNVTTSPYYMHMLTIGVRSLRSALGVNKPQIVYTAPLQGDTGEIVTDPSSDPSPSNANFLVVQKIPLKMPHDFNLAPVLNIVARDNLFGGILQRGLGNSMLDLQNFIEPIRDSKSNAWIIKETRTHVLNENELKYELEAEERAEKRTWASERRTVLLAVRKVQEIIEARCTLRSFHAFELESIEHIEQSPIKILNDEEIEEYKDSVLTKEQRAKLAYENAKEEERKLEEEEKLAAEVKSSAVEEKKTEHDAKSNVNTPEEKKDDKKQDEKKQDDKKQESDNKTNNLEMINLDEKKPETKENEEKHELLSEEELLRQQQQQALAAADDEIDLKEDESKNQEKEQLLPKEEKKEKKPSKKEQKKLDEKKLKEWDKENEENCFDIDSKIALDPSQFEAEYLKERPRVGDELEDTMDLMPFETIQLFTGQKGGFKIFGGEKREVGKIKGLWKLSDSDINPFGNGLKALVQTRTINVRLYILNGINLTSTDRDNSSDPYLVVKLGKEEFSTRSRYLPNTLNPKFHEAFEFHTKLPGPSQIEIEVWDWDGIGDDLVGRTSIDIEDRWFSKDWRRMPLKPLEERTLHNPRSAASYGKLRLWVDMFAKDDARNIPMIDISLPPKQKFEFRIICWQAKDVVIKDELTDQNDLRVTCKVNVDKDQKQETDIHWRAKYGKGSWNWRMIYPIELPFEKRTTLHFSMWDQDVFSASDSIGECNVNLDLLLRQAYLKREQVPRIILRSSKTKRFWLNMMHSNWPDEVQGKLQVSIELMTAEEASKAPAGLGRGDPNMNPYLPPPEGRFIWSLNPFSLLRQVLGDKLCFKICLIFCSIACVFILIYFGPQLFITVLSNLILKR